MSQKDINKTIDALFDDFVESGCNIDKMKLYGANSNINNEDIINPQKLNKKVKFKEVDNLDNADILDESQTQLDRTQLDHTQLDRTHFEDSSLELDFSNSFTGDLLNNFLLYFKKKNNKANKFTLLDGIDVNDPYSTNMALEEMFFEMNTFVENEKNNPETCKVLPFNMMEKSIVNSDELYCLMIDGKPELVSQSFFALLIELTNIKNLDYNEKSSKQKNYDIINLK